VLTPENTQEIGEKVAQMTKEHFNEKIDALVDETFAEAWKCG